LQRVEQAKVDRQRICFDYTSSDNHVHLWSVNFRISMIYETIDLFFGKFNLNIDDTFDDPNTMRSLNQYYYKTLIYELDLNKRSTKFVQSLEKVNNYSEHMSIK
jgi:hypothetical protein